MVNASDVASHGYEDVLFERIVFDLLDRFIEFEKDLVVLDDLRGMEAEAGLAFNQFG